MPVYNDPRRSEYWIFSAEHHKTLDHLGPDRSKNGLERTCTRSCKRKEAVKISIDQKVVVGVGNIYACEALNRAKFHQLAFRIKSRKGMMFLLRNQRNSCRGNQSRWFVLERRRSRWYPYISFTNSRYDKEGKMRLRRCY